MKFSHYPFKQRKAERAFTMVEVAIALAVIAFALVAIIGILPTGLTAQKTNRDETIINQDGPYFLEVIRSGGIGFDHLTNHVTSVGVVTIDTNSQTLTIDTNYFYDNYIRPRTLPIFSSNIIGMLTLPKGTPFPGPTDDPVEAVIANVRAVSGAAIESGGTQKEFAFSYQLTSEVVPLHTQWTTNVDQHIAGVIGSDMTDDLVRSNYVTSLKTHLYEVRVTCRWPLLPNNKVGPNRKTFRTVVSGKLDNTHFPRHFFQAQQFKKP